MSDSIQALLIGFHSLKFFLYSYMKNIMLKRVKINLLGMEWDGMDLLIKKSYLLSNILELFLIDYVIVYLLFIFIGKPSDVDSVSVKEGKGFESSYHSVRAICHVTMVF